MTHITDYGGAIDDYYPARMERIKDMELTELEKRADIEAEESRMTPEVLDGGWQPIEAAPKDGSVVLLAGGEFFCEKREDWVSTPASAAFLDNYWLIVGLEGGYVCVDYGNPTHWMPLPKAPS